jgi:hypothetical protein
MKLVKRVLSKKQDKTREFVVGQSQEFHRYEFKYLLNARVCQDIEREVKEFMSYDGHVDPDMDNMYLVRSLYFDDPMSTAFYEKTDGIMVRQKFRIRTYGHSFTDGMPLFLESKGRTNERTYKYRIAIAPEHLGKFFSSDQAWSLMDEYPDNELVEKFVFETHRRSLAPRVLVDYFRRPYVSDYDSNFRVTFDGKVTSTVSSELFPTLNQTNWHGCHTGWTILEVKFDRRLPKWFHRILQTYEMRRLSVSKFCLGMESCGVAVDLS